MVVREDTLDTYSNANSSKHVVHQDVVDMVLSDEISD